MSLLSRQPGKALYTALTLFSLFIRLPFLFLYYSPRALRPHPNWSLRQAVCTRLLRIWFRYASAIEFRYPISLEPGAEKERFVHIPVPKTQTLYRGFLADATVKPTSTGGTWFPRLYQPQSDHQQKVIFHLHGGGFVLSDARDVNCAAAAKVLVGKTSAIVFFLEYRLASQPAGHFPAALQDVVTAYQYLLDQGISASNIILSGDSAGANLTLAFLRYLAENQGVLPYPSAALLWSPWSNMVADRAAFDRHQNKSTDLLVSDLVVWGARAYVPPSMSRSHRYFSPLEHPFSTPVPLWIQVSGREVLRDEGVQFYDRMRRVGNRSELYEVADASHDVFLTAQLVGREDYLEQAADSARRFVDL